MEQGKYQIMLPLSTDEYEMLKADIRERGVQVPVEYDEGGNILDGFHRVKICEELGIKDFPTAIRSGMGEAEKRIHARQLNLARRHLNSEQKRELIEDRLKETPEKSDRLIAKELNVSDKTVGYARERLVSTAEIPQLERLIGADGKERPRAVRRSHAPVFSRDAKEVQRAFDILEKANPEQIKKLQAGQKDIQKVSREVTNRERREERIKKAEELAAESITPLNELGKFPIIYADPPWRYEQGTVRADADAIESHYPTMPLQEICDLPIHEISLGDCILFLWATSPKLAEAMKVIEAWEFVYRTCMVWIKDKIGLGYYARQQHELLLIAKKGTLPRPAPESLCSSVINASRTQHSKKPDIVYEIIEKLYPSLPKIELFARQQRKGWKNWGYEVTD